MTEQELEIYGGIVARGDFIAAAIFMACCLRRAAGEPK
jgi:hypothetical protein